MIYKLYVSMYIVEMHKRRQNEAVNPLNRIKYDISNVPLTQLIANQETTNTRFIRLPTRLVKLMSD